MTITVHAQRRRFTADEVMAMVAAGILAEDEPVELISGELVYMVPQGPQHRSLTVLIHEQLARAYRGLAHVQDHSNIHAGVDSLPEPDLAVVRGAPRDYMDHLPRGTELVLVVEVAVTTQREAREKAPVYARGAIGTYWLVDTRGRYVDVHTEPSPEGYGSVERLDETQSLRCPELDVELPVTELLP
jgi:Uma2 family endonuclease